MQHSLLCVTNVIIAEAVEKVKTKAKVALEKLGMGQLLQQHSMWDSTQLIPQVPIDHDDEHEEFEGYKGEESHADQKEAVISSIIQEVCCEEPTDVETDINTIYKDGLVDKKVKQTLQKLQQGLQLGKILLQQLPCLLQFSLKNPPLDLVLPVLASKYPHLLQ